MPIEQSSGTERTMNHQQTFELYRNQQGVCCTCGVALPDDPALYDGGHVELSRVDGGADTFPQCVDCNRRQGPQTLEEWDANGDVGEVNGSLLRQLVDLRDTMQDQRKGWANRILAIQRTADESDVELHMEYLAAFKDLEKKVEADLRRLVKEKATEEPVFDAVMQIKGISEVLTAKLLIDIDIRKAHSISALWKFAGYAPGFDKMKKGERRPFNRSLKTTCFVIAGSFLKCGSPYRKIYDEAKTLAMLKHPEWATRSAPVGHYHMHAMRVMMKLFLSHLWQTWRQIEGLPLSEPYAMAELGHTGYHDPRDFGWPDVEQARKAA